MSFDPWECVQVGKSISFRSYDGEAIRLVVSDLEVARRIAACMNACKGIPTEKLEAGALDSKAKEQTDG